MTARTPITGEEVADVLERAADLIAKPGAWTKGDYYRTLDGRSTDAERAECFCALGAIRKAGNYENTGENDLNPATRYLEAWLDRNNFGDGWGVHGWNDKSTQVEVVAALRSAATAARQQGEGK